MRVGFWWVFFSVFFLIFAWVYEYRKKKSIQFHDKYNKDTNSSGEEEMEVNFADFIRLEIRRRIASFR